MKSLIITSLQYMYCRGTKIENSDHKKSENELFESLWLFEG
jgi:hypothetical protein